MQTFLSSVQILLLMIFSGFAHRASANEGKESAIQFQIRTTTNSLIIDIPGLELDAPQLNVRIQSGDDILWEGRMDREALPGRYRFSIDGLKPKLWSPTHPNLYQLTCTLSDKGKEVKKANYRIGFRSFESKDGKIYLNGHPIFLRGIAINPPNRGIPDSVETSRAFALEYVRFMKSINVNIIRIRDDQTWFDVCDELGMMVFGGNYSAAVGGEKPPANYDKGVDWYANTKFQPIMHHPSLMIYALTNEVAFRGEKAKQWVSFLSYAHKELKKWDDTRLYIGNAGYGYGQSGDICDLHRYWGWYYASPFTFLHARDYDSITFPKKIQPLTFTECVGNYTGPDGRYNLTPDNKNPVSQMNWTGHAPASLQAQLADQHQSFVFKQATELLRRLRRINPELSGVFPFTIMFKNWHTVQSFVEMDPKAVADQARLSYQPVLISWENWQSQVYTGSTITPVAHVINDSDDLSALTDVKLIVRLIDDVYNIHVSDTIRLKDIPYYGIHSENVRIRIPEYLAEGNYRLEGIVLSDDREVSRNYSPLYIGRWRASRTAASQPVKLYDVSGQTRAAFDALGIAYQSIQSFDRLKTGYSVVIGENAADELVSQSANKLRDFIRKGGRLTILKQDSLHEAFVKDILPVAVRFPQMDIDNPSYPPPVRPSRNGYNINPERPGHPVFTGIDRAELRVWSDYTGWNEAKSGFPAIYPVTDGFVLTNKEQAAEKTAVLANYSGGLEGVALAEFFEGNGSAMLSGFDLVRRTRKDPVADRLLRNMIGYMAEHTVHDKHVLVDTPIRWGDYESEKGILTGINSGFKLNSKPALFGSDETIPVKVDKEGHMFAGARTEWAQRPGKQYVPYGRRMFGPYYHRGFGGIAEPVDANNPIGEGFFWCRVPRDTKQMMTLVWNPSQEDLLIEIEIHGKKVAERMIRSGSYQVVDAPVPANSSDLKVLLRGDRRLVVVETSFE